jgi:hypothetical protein
LLRRKPQQTPVSFDFLLNALHNTLAEGTDIFITFYGTRGTDLAFIEGQTRKKTIDTDGGREGQYFTSLDMPIRPGGDWSMRPFKGPGALTLNLPIGKYKVDFHVEGQTTKGCPFVVSSNFFVEIY